MAGRVLTEEEIAEVKARREAIRDSGPFTVVPEGIRAVVTGYRQGYPVGATSLRVAKEDGIFLGHAPTDYDNMLATIASLQARLRGEGEQLPLGLTHAG